MSLGAPITEGTIKSSKRWAKVFIFVVLGSAFFCFSTQSFHLLKVPAREPTITMTLEEFQELESVPMAEDVPNTLRAEKTDFEVPIEPEKTVELTPPPEIKIPVEPVQHPKKKELSKKKVVPKKISAPKADPEDKKIAKSENQLTGSQASPQNTEAIAGNALQARAKDQIVSLLVALVEKKKRYPKAARRNGSQGVVDVVFRINTAGEVIGASIRKKCGISSLDDASEDLANKIVGTHFHVMSHGMNVTVPIRYKLE